MVGWLFHKWEARNSELSSCIQRWGATWQVLDRKCTLLGFQAIALSGSRFDWLMESSSRWYMWSVRNSTNWPITGLIVFSRVYLDNQCDMLTRMHARCECGDQDGRNTLLLRDKKRHMHFWVYAHRHPYFWATWGKVKWRSYWLTCAIGSVMFSKIGSPFQRAIGKMVPSSFTRRKSQ